MRGKFARFLVLFLALSVTVNSQTAIGAPQSGKKCAKSGITKISSGMKFTCIKRNGKLVWNKGAHIPSPTPKPNASFSPTPSVTSSPAPSPSVTGSPLPTTSTAPSTQTTTEYKETLKNANPDLCRLKDGRKDTSLNYDHYERNNGFPLQGALLPTSGTVRFLTVLIDFPDAPGTNADLLKLRSQEKVMTDWFSTSSNGKLKAEVTTVDRWFRAPKNSFDYEISPNQYGALHPKFAQEFIDLTGSTFNWNGIHTVMFHFPDSQKSKFMSAQLGRNQKLNTPQGVKTLNYQYYGVWQHDYARSIASSNPDYWAGQWLHENLHDLGLTLHAPGNGFYSGVGQSQASLSLTLSAWETFKLGWLDDSQIFCLPKASLSNAMISLIPLEEAKDGNKIVVVPVDASKALVIEARRPIGLSSKWPKDASGLYIYRVDTAAVMDRSQEFNGSGLDNGNDPKYQKWAFYLETEQRPITSSSASKRIDPSVFFKDWLVREGESVQSEGVRIHFRKTGSLDWIEIVRLG